MDPVEAQNAMLTMAVGSELKIAKKKNIETRFARLTEGQWEWVLLEPKLSRKLGLYTAINLASPQTAPASLT